MKTVKSFILFLVTVCLASCGGSGLNLHQTKSKVHLVNSLRLLIEIIALRMVKLLLNLKELQRVVLKMRLGHQVLLLQWNCWMPMEML